MNNFQDINKIVSLLFLSCLLYTFTFNDPSRCTRLITVIFSESPANVAILIFVQIRHLIPGRLICKCDIPESRLLHAIHCKFVLSFYDPQCQFTRRFLTIRATRENVVLLNEYSSRVALNQHVSRPRTTKYQLIETCGLEICKFNQILNMRASLIIANYKHAFASFVLTN